MEPAPVLPAAAAPELPCTGTAGHDLLVRLGGLALTLGGLGVSGGARRRRRRTI